MKLTPFFSALAILAAVAGKLRANSETIFVGTYTNTSSRGIYTVRFDSDSGVLSAPTLAARVANPSFLAVSPDQGRLYAVDEAAVGRVNAFEIDPGSGRLTALNSRTTEGSGPAHLAVDPTGTLLVAANYGSGSICVFPLGSDGRLQPNSGFFVDHGTLGPDKARQLSPHAHAVAFSPDGRFAFVCDLGLDRVLIYRVDPTARSLVPSHPAGAAVPPGAGARHCVFSADGKFLYVVNEMGGSVSVFAWKAEEASLQLQQTISALPDGFAGANNSAEIALGPDGRFVYASNRGPNTITTFARDGRSGALAVVDRVSSGGVGPRNFAISPDGRWLICANGQGIPGDNLVVFRIDPSSGKLVPTGQSVPLGRAVCLVWWRK